MGISPSKLSWGDLFHWRHQFLIKKTMEVFEVTGSGAGNMGRACVRHGTAGLEALTKSATTVQPGQDTTQPAAVCFSFVVAELFQKPSFHSTKEGGKKKKKNPRLQPIQVWTSLFYSWKLHSFTVQLYHRQKHAKPLKRWQNSSRRWIWCRNVCWCTVKLARTQLLKKGAACFGRRQKEQH